MEISSLIMEIMREKNIMRDRKWNFPPCFCIIRDRKCQKQERKITFLGIFFPRRRKKTRKRGRNSVLKERKKHSLSLVFQYFSYWRRVPKTGTYSCHFLSWRIFNILISHLEKWIEKSEFCRQSIRIIWKVIWCRCGGLQWCWSREFSQKCLTKFLDHRGLEFTLRIWGSSNR